MSSYEEASTTTTMSNTNNNNSPSTNYSNNPNGTPQLYPCDTSPTDGSAIDVVKRKRGRPRKYTADVFVSPLPPPSSAQHNYTPVITSPTDRSTIDVADVSVSPLPPPGSTQHNYTPVITSPTDGSTIDVVKRKRGRPRKYPADVSVSPLPPPSSTQHDLTPEITSPTDGSTIDVEKRKRGRPRKYPADVSVSPLPPPSSTQHDLTPEITLPTDGSTIDVEKRKRGRPRKYPADVSVSPLPPPGSMAAAGDGGYSSLTGMSNSGKRKGRPPVSLNIQHHPAASSEMETQRLTEYERICLENIKRNDEMLASFKIKSKLADLTAFIKPHRVEAIISHKLKPKTPTVTRRSLRTQGKVPDFTGLKYKFYKELPSALKSEIQELEPVSMKDANTCSKSDQILISQLKNGDVHGRVKVKASIDLDSMKLAPKNVANVLTGKILGIKLFPSTDMRMVVVGTKCGTIGFWYMDADKEDGDGIYTYHTNPGLVSAILIQPFSTNKITTSCYGGQIRSLDIEKEIFALSYSTDNPITSMSQQPGDVNSLYFDEGEGVVRQWDQQSILSWHIHESIVNTIDFNPENSNIMATSSSDNTACIWDLRKLNKSKLEVVKLIVRKSPVHSAYFSPSGSFLATTSGNDKIGVLSGTNYDEEFMIDHDNQTGSYISSSKGIWGWDYSYIFVGNKKKGDDVISAYTKTLVSTLESPHMSAIPCRFDAHPFIPGMLAGATGTDQVYVWTS